jgi:hypothetical protein
MACRILDMSRHLDDGMVVPMDHSLRCLIGELLAAKSGGELERALNTIRAQGDASLRAVVAALADASLPLRLQRAAIALAIEVSGEEGVSLLLALLAGPNVDDEERAAAVRGLGGNTSPATLVALLNHVAASRWGGDTEAARAIFAHLSRVPASFDWAHVVGAMSGSRLNPLRELLGYPAPPTLAALAAAVEVERRTRRGPSRVAPPRSLPAAVAEDTVHNPYDDAIKRLRTGFNEEHLPELLGELDSLRSSHGYPYAVPTEAALRLLAQHQPLLEIGAGSGYWAWLLRQMHVDILAYDHDPPDGTYRNAYFEGVHLWTEVLEGGPEMVREHPNRALFLCWPPPGIPMTEECLAMFQGDVVLYAGEWRGHGATPAFFDSLEASFTQIAAVELPSWVIEDALRVFRRRDR